LAGDQQSCAAEDGFVEMLVFDGLDSSRIHPNEKEMPGDASLDVA
jgi:hypothetical protein